VPSNLRAARGKVTTKSRLGQDFAASRDSASRLRAALENLRTNVAAVAAAPAGSRVHIAAMAATMCAAFAAVQVAPLPLSHVRPFNTGPPALTPP
jgi:hypothetical protein